MKYAVITLILLSIITRPALAELSQDDLNSIKLLMQEELKPIKTDIVTIKEEIASLKGNFTGLQARVTDTRNLTYALIALIIAAIVPQYIYLLRSQKTTEQDRINQELREKIETLQQQRIVNP